MEAGGRAWPLVLAFVAVLSICGWTYLVAMVADMVPVMDMSQAGPGMGVLNRFNIFRDLSPEARAALAVLCLPAGATFGMPGTEMTLAALGKIFLMWSMMAVAMMLPTAVPMLRSYSTRLSASGRKDSTSALPVMSAALGYLLVWIAYALVATFAQWLLFSLGALSEMMAPVSLALTTSVLFVAGIYQFTPAKQACLRRCWYPRWIGGWEPGQLLSGFREGMIQGLACLGCCWAVMTVMFAVGIMNIVWIALLGGIMVLEKTFPSRFFPAAIGVFLILWAGFLASTVLLAAAPA